MRARSDELLQFAIWPQGKNGAPGERDRIAAGIAQDRALVQNQVSFESHQNSSTQKIATRRSFTSATFVQDDNKNRNSLFVILSVSEDPPEAMSPFPRPVSGGEAR